MVYVYVGPLPGQRNRAESINNKFSKTNFVNIRATVQSNTFLFQLLGYWMFGKIWCDVHGALDVLLSTSSIMNLCLISLDRSVVTSQIVTPSDKKTNTNMVFFNF